MSASQSHGICRMLRHAVPVMMAPAASPAPPTSIASIRTRTAASAGSASFSQQEASRRRLGKRSAATTDPRSADPLLVALGEAFSTSEDGGVTTIGAIRHPISRPAPVHLTETAVVWTHERAERPNHVENADRTSGGCNSMTVLDVLATGRLRPVHVVLAAVIGIGCGKERPFSSEAVPLEGSERPTSQAAPSAAASSSSLGGAAAVDCGGAECASSGGGGNAPESRRACLTDEDCPNPATPVCDAASGSCVPCLLDSDCAPERPFCRQTSPTSASNVCVQCTGDAQCPESSPVCDLGSNECTSRCQDSAQCSGTTPICDPAQRVCVQCQSSVDCSAPAPACDVATSRCVACLDDSTCAPGRFCNIQSHSCVGCLDTSQCTDAFNAHCQTDANAPEPFTCTGCVEERDCSSKDGLGSHCRTNDGRCVECIADTDCAGSPSTTTCSPDGACGPCVADADCAGLPGRLACLTGIGCVECTNDQHCTIDPTRRSCKSVGNSSDEAAVNTCVQCLDNSACLTPNASACTNNVCAGCTVDADCTHIDATPGAPGGARPVCDDGTCVECAGNRRDACGATVCDTVARTCALFPVASAGTCDPCVSDAQCEADERCAQQLFENTPAGFYCFPIASSTAPTCPPQLFIDPVTTNTIDGEQQTLCMPRRTTCPSIVVQTTVCTTDDDCGIPGLDDGLCVPVDATVSQCTMPCNTSNDCPSSLAACPLGACSL